MNCSEVQRILYDYLNRELNQMDRSRFESHLNVCPSCLKVLELERRFEDFVVSRMPKETAPAHLKGTILRRIEELEQPTRSLSPVRKRPYFRPALVLAPIGLVVVFMVILFFISKRETENPADILVQIHIQAGSSSDQLTYSSSEPQLVSSHLERELGFEAPLEVYVGPEVILKGGEVVTVCDCKVGLAYFTREGVGISLFLCNRGDLPCPKMDTISREGQEYGCTHCQGFNLLVWEKRDREFITVSKLPRSSLLDFASPEL